MLLADLPLQDYSATQTSLVCDISKRDSSWSQRLGAASRVAWSKNIQIGTTKYPLARPISGNMTLDGDQWALRMQGLTPAFLGKGKSPARAEQDLKNQVHTVFQHLYGMRPFQMSADERATWSLLQSFIDVAAYIRETPVRSRDVGHIEWLRGLRFGVGKYGLKIRWMDGKADYVKYERAPKEFAALRPGCWFEAIVERDAVAWRLKRILFVNRIEPLQPMSPEQASEHWDRLPVA